MSFERILVCRKKSVFIAIPLLFIFAFGFVSIAAGESKIIIPLRFHIVDGLPMEKEGLEMQSWVTKGDIENAILPEVNRIWQAAGIVFETESILISNTLSPPNKSLLIDGIVNSHRDSRGKSDPKRIKKLNKLIDWTHHHADAINIYLVPYLGEKSQGNAKPKRKRIFVGQWSDKASKAKKRPEKFRLIESRAFRKGSLSRTTAHELGHILGLKHPDKASQSVFGLLMEGEKAGYRLTGKEIDKARRKSANLAGIWVFIVRRIVYLIDSRLGAALIIITPRASLATRNQFI